VPGLGCRINRLRLVQEYHVRPAALDPSYESLVLKVCQHQAYLGVSVGEFPADVLLAHPAVVVTKQREALLLIIIKSFHRFKMHPPHVCVLADQECDDER